MIEFCLIRTPINREQQVPLLHFLALLEMDLVEITVDARSDFNAFRGFEASNIIIPLDHFALDRLDNGHDRWWRSGLRRRLATAPDEQPERECKSAQRMVGFHGLGSV